MIINAIPSSIKYFGFFIGVLSESLSSDDDDDSVYVTAARFRLDRLFIPDIVIVQIRRNQTNATKTIKDMPYY